MLHSIICDLWAVSLIHYNAVFIVLRQDMPALLWPHLLLLLHVWLNYPLLTAVGGWSHDLIADTCSGTPRISHNGFSEGDEIGPRRYAISICWLIVFYALHHYLAMSPTHHCCSHTHVHRRRRALIRIVRACARQLECRESVQLLVPWFRAIGFRTNLYDALTKTLLAPVVTAKNPYMCMHHSKHVHFVDQLDALDIHQHARIHHACDH